MTRYSLATPQDAKEVYKRYHTRWDHSLPAIIARKPEICGIIGSLQAKGIFTLGPFFADHPIIALRLIEQYEAILRSKGLSCYIFSVKKSNPWLRIVLRGNVKILSEDTEFMWFKRDLLCPILPKPRRCRPKNGS